MPKDLYVANYFKKDYLIEVSTLTYVNKQPIKKVDRMVVSAIIKTAVDAGHFSKQPTVVHVWTPTIMCNATDPSVINTSAIFISFSKTPKYVYRWRNYATWDGSGLCLPVFRSIEAANSYRKTFQASDIANLKKERDDLVKKHEESLSILDARVAEVEDYEYGPGGKTDHG